VNERGEVVLQKNLLNEPEILHEFFQGLDAVAVAMEASYAWEPVYELLERMGLKTHLAHPMKTRIIADAKLKTDMKDSEALARLLQLNWLPEAYVPPREIRELRRLVRLRAYLVRRRTSVANRVRAELVRLGLKAIRNPFSRKWREALKQTSVTLRETLELYEFLSKQIARLEAEIERVASENQQARLLMTIPGIGPYSALTILAEIGDVSRFRSPEHLCSYAGLVPSLHQSGDTVRLGPITKQGSRLLRWILIQCAWMHLFYGDSRLTDFFWRLARRKGKKRAIVAMARKLLVAIYWMLVRNEPFKG
jgi:transposase